MAAHAYTMLKEIATRPMSLEMIQHGLGYSMAGDHFNYFDWESLNNATDRANMQEIATSLLPKYQAVWEFLDKPITAEEWNRVRFDLKKHHKHKAFIELFFRKPGAFKQESVQ